MQSVMVIGIAGGTGSGKTTITRRLMQRFGSDVCMVSYDNYYKARHDTPFEERAKINYDHPDAFDTELFLRDLRALKAGKTIQCPIYDYAIHDRLEQTRTLKPAKVILVEGILIFAEKALLDLMDIKVFVDTDADVRLARRVVRDVESRGRTVRSIVDQWQTTVKPMHEMYVEPSKKSADIIVPEGGDNPVALDLITGKIERHLAQHI